MDAPRGYEEPPFGLRLVARLLDLLVLLLPALLFGFALGGVTGRIIVFVLAAAYEILLTAKDGQTLGKQALGLRIVDIEDGGLIDLQQAFLRWLLVAGIGSAISLFVGPSLSGLYDLVILLPILQPPLHRGLHDRGAGTIVTRVH